MSETLGRKEMDTDNIIGKKHSQNISPLIDKRIPEEALIPHASTHQHAALNETPLIPIWMHRTIPQINKATLTTNQITKLIPT